MGLGQTRQQLYSPALFCGHSWSYDGPIENILCQNDFTCPIMHFVRFLVLDQTGTVISSPGHRWANLGPMVGRRVDRAKIYLLKFSTCPNIHYIRFDQPLGHSWSYDCSEGGLIEIILCQIDSTCPIMHFVRFLALGQTGPEISSPAHRWATLGPMVCGRVDRSKIYLLKSSTCPNIHYIRFSWS